MPSLLELVKTFPLHGLTNYAPAVYRSLPSKVELADYWVTDFGAEDQSSDLIITIQSFRVNNGNSYVNVATLQECIDTVKTFYWDAVNQELFAHLAISVDPLFDNFSYGAAYRFCSGKTLYIDNEEYIPILLSSPSIAQSEDLIDYDQLDFISGSFQLDNNNQDLDFIINENIIGNDAFYSHIPEGKDTRDDIVQLGSFFVKDYRISENTTTVDMQDRREAGSIKVPTEKFNDTDYPNIDPELVGEIIPLLFGIPRETGAISVNSELLTGNAEYKLAQELISIGTTQVSIDDIWTTITPVSVNLPLGEFILPEFVNTASTATISDNGTDNVRITKAGAFTGVLADQKAQCVFSADYTDGNYNILFVDPSGNYIDISQGYTVSTPTANCNIFNGARLPSGALRDVKILSPSGIAISKTTDIIHILSARYENVSFDANNYDLTEWNSVSDLQSTGSYMITEKVFLYDVIKDIQNGSLRRFRYEFKTNGNRTLILNDDNALIKGLIYNVDFDEIEVYTDSDLIYSDTLVNYNKSYYSEKYLKKTEDLYRGEVTGEYRKDNTLTVDSVMTNPVDASSRALNDSERFRIVPELTILKLKGSQFLDLRIYDIFNIELTKGFTDVDKELIIGREFYGFKKCKVLSIDPDSDENINTVKFQILGEATFVNSLIFDNGDTMVFDNFDIMTDDGLE